MEDCPPKPLNAAGLSPMVVVVPGGLEGVVVDCPKAVVGGLLPNPKPAGEPLVAVCPNPPVVVPAAPKPNALFSACLFSVVDCCCC